MSDGTDLASLLFLAFAALLLYMLISHARSVRPYEWILYPALLVLPLVYFRFRPLFAFLLAADPGVAPEPGAPAFANTRVVAGPGFAVPHDPRGVSGREHSLLPFWRRHPRGCFSGPGSRLHPAEPHGWRMFNSYGFGGYLIWTLWPERRVFIDGREDVYLGPGILEEYVHCFDSRERWQALVAKYGIDYAWCATPSSRLPVRRKAWRRWPSLAMIGPWYTLTMWPPCTPGATAGTTV